MAKSSRTGENRGRRPAARRDTVPQPEELLAPERKPAMVDDRATTAAAALGTRKRPTREEVARRAYELFVARGGTHGYDIEDWLKAERELRGR